MRLSFCLSFPSSDILRSMQQLYLQNESHIICGKIWRIDAGESAFGMRTKRTSVCSNLAKGCLTPAQPVGGKIHDASPPRSVQRFTYSSRLCSTHTRTHTHAHIRTHARTHHVATCDTCSNSPHLCMPCGRCDLKSSMRKYKYLDAIAAAKADDYNCR